MTEQDQKALGKTLWAIADDLRGAMNADDFRDYMLSFLFLRYLSDNYEASAKKELGRDYPEVDDDKRSPLALWYEQNPEDIEAFEKQMRRKVHYVIKPDFMWQSIAELARTQDNALLETLQKGFKYIENESFASALMVCSLKSIWILRSWVKPIPSAIKSSAPLSLKSLKVLRTFLPIAMH